MVLVKDKIMLTGTVQEVTDKGLSNKPHLALLGLRNHNGWEESVVWCYHLSAIINVKTKWREDWFSRKTRMQYNPSTPASYNAYTSTFKKLRNFYVFVFYQHQSWYDHYLRKICFNVTKWSIHLKLNVSQQHMLKATPLM